MTVSQLERIGKSLSEGAGFASLVTRSFNRGHFVPVPLVDVPSTTTPPTLLYTVPAGYVAVLSTIQLINATGSAIVPTFYVMAGAGTAANPTDRVFTPTAAANTTTTTSLTMMLDEAWTVWVSSPTNPGLTVWLSVLLMPKPVPGGLWTPQLTKSVPLTDTTIYSVTTAGNWAVPTTLLVHNTTGSAITSTIKLKRAADVSPLTLDTRSIAGLATTSLGLGSMAALQNGDILTAAASGAGLTLFAAWNEHAISGI